MTRVPLTATLMSLAALSVAQDDGPVPNRVARAANLVFLRPSALGRTLAPGEREQTFGLLIVNEARRRPGVVEDAETWRGLWMFRRGDRAGEWIVEVPVISRGGGILDATIQSWENSVMGYHNPGREGFDRGQSEITLGGQSYGSAFGLGDVTVGRGVEALGLTARAWIKLPTGNAARLTGSGGVDAGFSLERRWSLSRDLTLNVMGGGVAQSRGAAWSGTRPVVWTGSASLAYKRNSRDVWLLQVDSEGRAIDSGDTVVDRDQRVTSLAYRRKLNDRQDLTVWFSEDDDFSFLAFAASKTGPDFTIGARLRTRF